MPSATATWAIPYPLGTDPFCDGDQFTQDIAERVDTLLDTFDSELVRIQQPPMAKVSVSTAVTLGVSPPSLETIYDTVQYDTANMVNLAVDDNAITLPQNGYYIQGGNCNATKLTNATAGAAFSASWLAINVGTTGGRASQHSRDQLLPFHVGASILKQYSSFGTLGAEVTTDIESFVSSSSLSADGGTNMVVRWFSDL
jgi:hypothetical protein